LVSIILKVDYFILTFFFLGDISAV